MNDSALARFLGGSPAAVAVRLVVISFIVGALLVMWGFEPGDIVDGTVQLFRRLADFALTDFHQFGRVLLTGAIVVVPIWFIAACSTPAGRAERLSLFQLFAAAWSCAAAPTSALSCSTRRSLRAFVRPPRISPINRGPR
jgi:hypothetical protein